MAKPRCLILDASLMVRRVAARIVRDLGYEVIEAESGQEALTHCQAVMPTVILMDWRTADMDGAAFIAALRENAGANTPIAKIVFCTADRRIERITHALSVGADEYIMKPFDSDILESKFRLTGLPVETHPGQSQAQAQARGQLA